MFSHKSMMAASIDEPPMSEVDLDEDARRARALELERYHHLPVHHLHQEKELREVVLPPTPTVQRHTINGEHPVDVKHGQGQPATLTVSEQHIAHQHTPEHQTKVKEKKSVKIFSGFGRKGHTAVGEGGDHHFDMEKNGATSSHTFGQGHPEDYDKPVHLTVYPGYLKSILGILRIAQLLVGVIVCAAVNAERCIPNSVSGIVCGSASSPLWTGYLGGQGYVLFVGIIFILGNFALIFYHICTRPRQKSITTTTKPSLTQDKTLFGELVYNAAAVVMYIIAASVESWYASWTTLDVPRIEIVPGVRQGSVGNVYRSQWIAAAVFAWINVILYALHLAYMFLRR